MSYIAKNLVLFVSVVLAFLILFLGAHVFSLDREMIREKMGQLSVINDKFEKDLGITVKKSFSPVNFLAKTSYPAVALDFGMSQQFFDVAREILPDDGMGLILFDEKMQVVSSFGTDSNLTGLSKSQMKDEKIFIFDKSVVYYKAIVSNGSIRGYLAGIYPFEKIERIVISSYRDVSTGLELLHPSISLVDEPSHDFPFGIKFHQNNPTFLQPNVNLRWLAVIICLSLVILAAFTRLLRNSLKRPIDDLNLIAKRFSNSDDADATDLSLPKDPLFRGIAESLLSMNRQRRQFEFLQRENEIAVKLSEVAQQVAHDIRSPLAALDMAVKQTADLPEENRLLIRSAVQRIHDIANDLSRKKKDVDTTNQSIAFSEESSVQLLSGLLDSIVSEKRLQYRDRIGIEIESDIDQTSYGLFASVQPIEFKRVISNLINNAIEALRDKGKIDIKLFGGEKVVIQVHDSGQGIPEEILSKLMRRGETHGKSGGSGLGLYHARTSIEKWGGSIEITSIIGEGTTVTLVLPKAISPSWFVAELSVPQSGMVVVVDDDDSIHRIWKQRFETLRSSNPVNLVHFSSPEEFITWQNQNPVTNNRLFLCDYEFLNHSKTGLDVIKELHIASKTVLVTSRFEEPTVRIACETIGVRLIPKNLAGFVPISMAVPTEIKADMIHVGDDNSERIDAILIDDDDLVHMNWKMAAKLKNKIVRVYIGPEEFWKDSKNFAKDIPIYVDSNLSDGVKGEDVSWMMGKKGFSNLHLATGYDATQFDDMPWLKSIVGKNPPWT